MLRKEKLTAFEKNFDKLDEIQLRLFNDVEKVFNDTDIFSSTITVSLCIQKDRIIDVTHSIIHNTKLKN
ncbi:MAG: hypothetical protein FWD47_11500 [Treponema sp.]|nr:hypothetical protein [Treponema sp.]